jgi:predicted transcriptional regulator
MIDMREIAAAFGLTLDVIEKDLSELITSGAIKAKIDSH